MPKRKRPNYFPLAFFKSSFFLPFVIFLFVFYIYLFGISQTVTGGDVGDFLTATALRGLPHPPGFPLFMLLSILFSFLPLPVSLATKIGILSSLVMALSVVMVFLTVHRLVKTRTIAADASLCFAFLYPVWLYAHVAEVFSLTQFFLTLLIYLAIRFVQEKGLRVLYLLSFVFGLSLSVHQALILFAPVLIYSVFIGDRFLVLRFRTILLCVGLFFLGLLPYLYVPIAGHFETVFKWGRIETVNDIVRFVLRLDYGWVADAAKTTTASSGTLGSYFNYWSQTLGIPLLLLFFFGIYHSIKTQFRIATGLLIGLLLFGPFFVVYSGLSPVTSELLGAMERFYLLSSTFIIIFVGFGIVFCYQIALQLFAKRRIENHIRLFFCVILFFFPAYLFLQNLRSTDLHEVKIGEYYAIDSLASLPPHSLLLSSSDTATLNIYYVQYVLGMRKDAQLLSRLPLDNYINSNGSLRSKRDLLLSSKIVQSRNDANIMTLLIAESSVPIFATSNQYEAMTNKRKAQWIPYGLTFKLATENDDQMPKATYLHLQTEIFGSMHLHAIAKAQEQSQTLPLLLRVIPQHYARQLIFTASYLSDHYRDPSSAVSFLKQAIALYPKAVEPYEMLGSFYAMHHQCQISENYFVIASRLDPSSIDHYREVFRQLCKS